METYSFTLLLSETLSPELVERIYGRCDDVVVGERQGTMYAAFDRDAISLTDAVLSAIADIEETAYPVQVRHMEPEELVTASDIAQRTGRTRASISQLVDGERGPGNFPAPAAFLGARRPVWRWLDVSTWFGGQTADDRQREQAAVVAAINGALDLRRYAGAMWEAEAIKLLRWVNEHVMASSAYAVVSKPREGSRLPSIETWEQTIRGSMYEDLNYSLDAGSLMAQSSSIGRSLQAAVFVSHAYLGPTSASAGETGTGTAWGNQSRGRSSALVGA